MKEALAITHLLKEHDAPFGATRANRLLIELGVLEEAQRESSVTPGKFKSFKKLSAEGEHYGRNDWNNYGDAQPRFYADTFPELLERMLAADGGKR